MHKFVRAWVAAYANDFDCYIPEVWAQEGLMILEKNLVMAGLVYRDYEDKIANEGDVVNAHAPATYTMKRKADSDDVTIQDGTATNVPVKLNQHGHVSFLIRDGEESKGLKTLLEENLKPAVVAIAQGVDEAIMGCMWDFMGTTSYAGKLGTDPTVSTLTTLVQKLDDQKVPMDGRNLVICPSIKRTLSNIDNIVIASAVGDDGSKLRLGNIGMVYGLQTVMSQVCPQIAAGNTTVLGAINNGAGYAVGDTVLTTKTFTLSVTPGTWCTIAGDMTPQRITAATGSPCTQITISPGLRYAVADSAVITTYTPGAVNYTSYASGYSKTLVVDGFSVAPKTGQLVTFGATGSSKKYGAMSTPTTIALDLNDALAATVSEDDVVGIGPSGNYGFGFHKNAIALVSRPMAMPKPGTGALSSVVQYGNIAMRITMSYQGTKQGMLVTVDVLYGVKSLDSNLGAVLFG